MGFYWVEASGIQETCRLLRLDNLFHDNIYLFILCQVFKELLGGKLLKENK